MKSWNENSKLSKQETSGKTVAVHVRVFDKLNLVIVVWFKASASFPSCFKNTTRFKSDSKIITLLRSFQILVVPTLHISYRVSLGLLKLKRIGFYISPKFSLRLQNWKQQIHSFFVNNFFFFNFKKFKAKTENNFSNALFLLFIQF